MKRYLVFAGDFIPKGGFNDFRIALDEIADAERSAKWQAADGGHQWAHVVDSTTGKIILVFQREVGH